MKFDEDYYRGNRQDRDRPALWFYCRLWRHYCPPGPVLEFGCGVGYLARRLSRYAETFGVEINPFAVAQIASIAPDIRLVADLSTIPEASLASIVSLHVLEHIPDAELLEIGKQFRRILAPGGRLLLVMPDKGGAAHRAKGNMWLALTDPTHINLKSHLEWRSFFESRWDFKTIGVAADGYYDFPYSPRFLPRLMEDTLRILRTAVQFLAGRLLLKPGDGEAVIFLLERKL